MQLPGEQASNEFVLILPFTPANRNNMIGWMAGRSDGDNYGKLLVYNFPQSRLIEGPLQIDTKIKSISSGAISPRNPQGSRVLRGHLLLSHGPRFSSRPVYLQPRASRCLEVRPSSAIQGVWDRGKFRRGNTLYCDAGKAPTQTRRCTN